MNTFKTSSIMNRILIFSVTCLCLTRTSHALSLRQKLIALHSSVDQINDTLNETVTGLREKVGQISKKLDRITGTLDEVVSATACPENFSRFESSCYYFSEPLPRHGGDQSYARSQCEIKGAKLVSIETKQEAVFLNNQTVSGNGYWTSTHRHGSYWVGEATGMNVTDGYLPWAHGHPGTTSSYCAYFHGSNGKLYTVSCSNSGFRYICETKTPSCL